MPKFTVVTGNKNKIRELQRMLPDTVEFDHVGLVIEEIQNIDPVVITKDKARKAYAELNRPVLVEDVSAGLVSQNGLPGPFIKFYEQQLGRDALYKIGGDGAAAEVSCTMCYFDGQHEIVATGTVAGTIVKPRVMAGFGFDCVFVPEGEELTYAEMTPEQKDTLSHRALAVRALIAQL